MNFSLPFMKFSYLVYCLKKKGWFYCVNIRGSITFCLCCLRNVVLGYLVNCPSMKRTRSKEHNFLLSSLQSGGSDLKTDKFPIWNRWQVWCEWWNANLLSLSFLLDLFLFCQLCNVELDYRCERYVWKDMLGNDDGMYWTSDSELFLTIFPGSCITHDEGTQWTSKTLFLACVVPCHCPGTPALRTARMGKVLWIQWVWPSSGVRYLRHVDRIDSHG